MEIFNFSGYTMREAMAQVRGHLGEDAIIVSTERSQEGLFVVVAKGTLQEISGADVRAQLVLQAKVLLEKKGLPQRSIDILLDVFPKASVDFAQDLEEMFQKGLYFSSVLEDLPLKPLLFLGPPGSGKTTSLVKVAVQARQKNLPVHLVSLDVFKEGALDQLQILVKKFNIKVHSLSGVGELKDLLLQLSGNLVLIDTTALNPYILSDMTYMASLIQVLDLTGILVLASGGDVQETLIVGKLFKTIGVSQVLMTKLDVFRSSCALLSLSIEGKMALGAMNFSSNISDSLENCSGASLAQWVQGKLYNV